MAELLIRAGQTDVSLMERILSGPRDRRPHRLVVDAHVAAAEPRLGVAARTAGVPFVIDPQTHFLQDVQHPDDPWARLPFASAALVTPSDLIRGRAAAALVDAAVDYQLAHGATTIVLPYVHIGGDDDRWVQAQLCIWDAARVLVNDSGLRLPTIAVAAVGWRLLNRPTWPGTLLPLKHGLDALRPSEIGLAASRVDAGAKPADRLASFVAALRTLSTTAPVVAWQQGMLGEAAIAAGAAGYECGIGWREHCDLRAAMAAHREPRTGGGGPRPVYIDALRRSVSRSTVAVLLERSSIVGDLVCVSSSCCAGGKRDLIADARPHAIASRLRSLDAVDSPAQPAWKWKHLSEVAAHGLDLAERINRFGGPGSGIARVDTRALGAVFELAESQRQILGRRRAA